MSGDNRSVGFAGVLNLIFARRRRWFSFIENVVLTGLLQFLATRSHSWALWILWFVSVMFLIAPIGSAPIDGLSWLIDRFPWTRIGNHPRVITAPAMTAMALIVSLALLLFCQYTAFQIANVIAFVADSHAALH
jgi:hypothetical protein